MRLCTVFSNIWGRVDTFSFLMSSDAVEGGFSIATSVRICSKWFCITSLWNKDMQVDVEMQCNKSQKPLLFCLKCFYRKNQGDKCATRLRYSKGKSTNTVNFFSSNSKYRLILWNAVCSGLISARCATHLFKVGIWENVKRGASKSEWVGTAYKTGFFP